MLNASCMDCEVEQVSKLVFLFLFNSFDLGLCDKFYTCAVVFAHHPPPPLAFVYYVSILTYLDFFVNSI